MTTTSPPRRQSSLIRSGRLAASSISRLLRRRRLPGQTRLLTPETSTESRSSTKPANEFLIRRSSRSPPLPPGIAAGWSGRAACPGSSGRSSGWRFSPAR
uniref:Uncharacterized protein n=1 Tax=uncultured marine virus TaxID=186617 RepID=A0A0F7LAM4_9VIRU|nr:hypothetical protein [uncultured marine virus]